MREKHELTGILSKKLWNVERELSAIESESKKLNGDERWEKAKKRFKTPPYYQTCGKKN